ncbi:MAG: hypothetical protein ACREXQ_05875, partial [Polaromonas sp.]
GWFPQWFKQLLGDRRHCHMPGLTGAGLPYRSGVLPVGHALNGKGGSLVPKLTKSAIWEM